MPISWILWQVGLLVSLSSMVLWFSLWAHTFLRFKVSAADSEMSISEIIRLIDLTKT